MMRLPSLPSLYPREVRSFNCRTIPQNNGNLRSWFHDLGSSEVMSITIHRASMTEFFAPAHSTGWPANPKPLLETDRQDLVTTYQLQRSLTKNAHSCGVTFDINGRLSTPCAGRSASCNISCKLRSQRRPKNFQELSPCPRIL